MPPRGPGKNSARERVLAEWRRTDLSALERGRVAAKSCADIMPKVLSGVRLDKRRAEAEVLTVWKNLIDPVIVAHAQPTGVRKGTLFVSVDSNAWLSEIVGYRRKEILARLQHAFGRDVIARISFRVG